SGSRYLPPCLDSHAPLDLVVIMLGTNDLKQRFSLPPGDIAAGVGVLADIVQKSAYGPGGKAPELLILIPPQVRKLSNFAEMFAGSVEKSLGFPSAYQAMAEEKGIPVLDIGGTVRFSDEDGIHFEADQLDVLGRLVAGEVRGMI
ncbi:MAG: arylesterase, partial [Spirochaetaceae bacterium]|nr:arylesterase [Spirochaetaceae bacterium]